MYHIADFNIVLTTEKQKLDLVSYVEKIWTKSQGHEWTLQRHIILVG